MSQQPPKQTHSWKRAKSENALLAGRSFNEHDKKGKTSRTLKLRKTKRRDSDEDCDDEAAKYNCMPQQITKDGKLMLEVRSGKKRLQVWKACRVQLVMSTSYAMTTFGKKQFLLMCITGGLLGLSKRYLSIPLADIHAIYKGGKDSSKVQPGQERLSFVLQTSDKQLHFRATNDNEMLDWVAEVKASLALERANGFLPSIFHVRIGPDQQVPMTDALLAFHPHRNPEQLHIRQALSETTLYTCHIADILRFGFAHEGALLWVEAQPRDSALATEKILLLCPNNSRPDVVQALQCNLQSILGGAGNTVQASNQHQTIYSVKDRFAIGVGGAIRRRPLSVSLGAQAHQPRGAIRRHGQPSPFKRARPHSQTEQPEEEEADGAMSDWRMDVQKHKEQLVKHIHRNLLRQRSRSLGSIPMQGMPLASLPAKPDIMGKHGHVLFEPGRFGIGSAGTESQDFLETFHEDAGGDVFSDGDSSDGCIRATPPAIGQISDHALSDGGNSQAPPAEFLANANVKEVGTNQQANSMPSPQSLTLPAQHHASPPPPPPRRESSNRLLPLKKVVEAPLPPPPDFKIPLMVLDSLGPCYGELESRASLESSPVVSPAHQDKLRDRLQVPPAPDNVSTSSEPYVYDHLHIKAEYERRLREEAERQRNMPPDLETIQSTDLQPQCHPAQVVGDDHISMGSAGSWDDGADYVPVSQAMQIKPSSSDDEDVEDNVEVQNCGEYVRLKDNVAPPTPRVVVKQQNLPAVNSSLSAGQTANGTGSGTATGAGAGPRCSANGHSNCNSVFSCVSNIASSCSVDDFSPSTSALHNLAPGPPVEDCDYDYPRSSRRATIVVSGPSSPSPSCSSLSGSGSMEEIAASLWTRKRSNTASSAGSGIGKRMLMPSGDTASFVTSLRKGAASANGGQQDKIIEDLLACLSPSHCRSPYHTGIGLSPSQSSSKPSSPQLERNMPSARSPSTARRSSADQSASDHTITFRTSVDERRDSLLSPRELTERASTSCYDLLQQLS